LLVAALVGACDEANAPDPATSFDLSNGPANPGHSGLFRIQQEFLTATRDDAAGLVSLIGWTHSVADFCDAIGTLNLVDAQLRPHDAGEINSLMVDREAPVQIYSVGPTDRLCLNLRGATPLYQGTARFQRTDNNFTETGTEGGRANSFGWTADGILRNTLTGAQVQYHETVRIVSNPQTDEFVDRVVSIRVLN